MKSEILKGKKILIVEDDLASRLYLNKILEKTEAVLINAGDGFSAVRTAMENPDLALILMDIQLPVMDGYSSTKKIKDSGHNCKIVAQTAYSLADELEKIKSAGFDDYIIKPIFADQLIDKLSLVMAEK
ncbi:MAG: response regulator [Bacteroidales bacterium]|nr:response regulator [Bacteroidales bacterium]MBN2861840.1 response regulator [Bacteroidales bacterium]